MERPWLVKKLQGLGVQTVRGGGTALCFAVLHHYRGQPQVAFWMFAIGVAMIPLGVIFAGLDYCCTALQKIATDR